MTHRTDLARGQEIVARWCNLAEQRLDYLTELFETGRWRRYHTEQDFLENIREARAAVEVWRDLLTREASLDNSPVDLSWLGRGKSKLPQRDISPIPERRPETAALVEATMSAVAAALETAVEVLEEPPVVADAPPLQVPFRIAPPPILDLDTIQARYPLLRNTL